MFEGALTALVTPFRNDRVDEPALRAIVSEQIAGGIDGLVPCGTTGESVPSHTPSSTRDRDRGRRGRRSRPVIAGVGTASTRHTLELAEAAQRHKVDGLLVVVPYYNKPTQEGRSSTSRDRKGDQAAGCCTHPGPHRRPVVATLERLAAIETIVAIKESTATVQRSSEIIRRFQDRFTVLSGDDMLTLSVMAVGGHGVISVASNVAPKEVSQLVDLVRAGDLQGARRQHYRLFDLFEALFVEANPGPVKAALALRGLTTSEIRLPMVAPAAATLQRLRSVLAELGQI